ncbi:MAG TPA: 1-acyl-sn-glycerol-3-phosphate acyltransferase [Gallionella sp.]|nr:MAG: glycerol acyltransferase [Gallionellales bacterium GWA2_54_124]OGT20557.1 MAG: glycerol acyltransferase [Gallionellales bacterium RIFOXYD12_FULL_53_10]HCI53929.1 1-acyl-sn-glycerol-3-phosphate acyltransferase [Gallionella sp.]
MLRHKMIALFRAARMALHLLYGLMIALIFPRFDADKRRRIARCWSADLLHILNIRIEITATDALHKLASGLIVCNHISWLDVFVLNSVLPTRFVAKTEVKSWPVIGWLCARSQTLFIKRGHARDAARLNRQIINLLQSGDSLVVFPEGTSTDGRHVAGFHASLLQPAIDAAANLYPLALRYQDAHGTHSTAPAYIGETTFAASLWNILKCENLHAHLSVTPTLCAADFDRRSLTATAHQQIRTAVAAMHKGHPLPEGAAADQPLEENLKAMYSMLLPMPGSYESDDVTLHSR